MEFHCNSWHKVGPFWVGNISWHIVSLLGWQYCIVCNTIGSFGHMGSVTSKNVSFSTMTIWGGGAAYVLWLHRIPQKHCNIFHFFTVKMDNTPTFSTHHIKSLATLNPTFWPLFFCWYTCNLQMNGWVPPWTLQYIMAYNRSLCSVQHLMYCYVAGWAIASPIDDSD